VAGGILNLLPLKTVALYTVICSLAALAAAKVFLKIEKRYVPSLGGAASMRPPAWKGLS
jgi:hypothetical protein